MKRVISVAVLALVGLSAQAETFKDDAVACISQRYLQRYLSYDADEAEFAKNMIERAQCVTLLAGTKVAPVSEVGEFKEVETEDGFRVWVKEENIQ